MISLHRHSDDKWVIIEDCEERFTGTLDECRDWMDFQQNIGRKGVGLFGRPAILVGFFSVLLPLFVLDFCQLTPLLLEWILSFLC